MVKDWIALFFNVIALPVVVLVLKSWINGTNSKLDTVIEFQKQIAVSDAVQNEKIKNVEKKIESHDKRLNNHGRRLKKLESKK